MSVYLSEGKALESEKGKVLMHRLFYEQRREVKQGFYCVLSELLFILTLEGLILKKDSSK
jgi:hypothetical protein